MSNNVLNAMLKTACQTGSLNYFKYFENKGANDYSAAFHIACTNGHLNIVRYILSKNTLNSCLDGTPLRRSYSAYKIAESNGYSHITNYLDSVERIEKREQKLKEHLS